jgi:hypothetical protein
MPPWARILGAVAALLLVYYVAVFAADASAGSVTLDALIATWAARYGVDPKAVIAVILQEQFTGQGVVPIVPPASGAWPSGDSGTSHGPMQVLERGAIAAWEAQNGSVADGTGSYKYLDAVGNNTAMEIGVWYLSQAIHAAGGISPDAFGKYNAGLGGSAAASTIDPQTGAHYGDEAFQNYQTLGGTAGAVADSGGDGDQSAGADDSGDASGDAEAAS